MFETILEGQDPAKVFFFWFPLVARTYNAGQISVKQFKELARLRSKSPKKDVKEWTFNGYILTPSQ